MSAEPDDAAGDAVAIAELFSAYAAGFDDADSDAVADLFAYPAVIWQFGRGHDFADADELVENVEALIEVFDDAGIVLTTPEIRKLDLLGNAAAATVGWRQEDREGAVLHEFTCHYLLHRIEGAWLIVTVANEEDQEPAEGF